MTSSVKSHSPVYLPTELFGEVAKHTDLRTRKSMAQSSHSLKNAARANQNSLKITHAASLSQALREYSTGGLNHLNLSASKLDDEKVAEITDRALSLVSLDISHNRLLSASAINSLMIIRTLEEFNLSHTYASESALKGIHELTQLKKLDLSGNTGINNDVVKMLIRCPALEELNLSGTGVTFECISSLKEMENLKAIDLSSNRHINDHAIEQLAECHNLEIVILKATAITDGCAASLGKMKSIKILVLSENRRVSGDILNHLSDCKDLENLNLSGISISDSFVDKLIQISGLKKLDISGRKFLYLEHLTKLGNNLTKLNSLNLSGNIIIKDNISALNAFTCLEALEMRDINKRDIFEDNYIHEPTFAGSMTMQDPHLWEIRKNLNSEGIFHQLAEIIKVMPALKRADFSGNLGFDDQAAKLISESYSLESLDLSGTRVGLPGIESMKKMPNLRILKLSPAHYTDPDTREPTVTNVINDECIKALAECTQLEELDVSSKRAKVPSSLLPGAFNPLTKNMNFRKLYVQYDQIDNETKTLLNEYGISVDVTIPLNISIEY